MARVRPRVDTHVRYGPLWATMGHHVLWATMGHYGPLWATMGHYGPLWALSATIGHYGLLWATMGHYGATMGYYGRHPRPDNNPNIPNNPNNPSNPNDPRQRCGPRSAGEAPGTGTSGPRQTGCDGCQTGRAGDRARQGHTIGHCGSQWITVGHVKGHCGSL